MLLRLLPCCCCWWRLQECGCEQLLSFAEALCVLACKHCLVIFRLLTPPQLIHKAQVRLLHAPASTQSTSIGAGRCWSDPCLHMLGSRTVKLQCVMSLVLEATTPGVLPATQAQLAHHCRHLGVRCGAMVRTSAAAMWLPSSSALIPLRLVLPHAVRARRLPAPPALLLPSTAAAAAAAWSPAKTLGRPDSRCRLDSFRCRRGLRASGDSEAFKVNRQQGSLAQGMMLGGSMCWGRPSATPGAWLLRLCCVPAAQGHHVMSACRRQSAALQKA